MSPVSYATKKNAWRDERVAREYDARRFETRLQRRKHARDEALVLAFLARTSGVASVLDVACGTCRMLPALSGAGYRVAGVDLSAEMLAAGRARARVGPLLIQADAERLPLAAGSVDAVVCVRFLFHVDDGAARVALLGEMARVARRAVVGEIRYGATLKHVGRRVRRHARLRPAFDRAGVAAELERCGLALVSLRPVSRLFSDKAFFLARPWNSTAAT